MSVAIVPSRPISYDKNPIIGLARMQEKTARIIDNMLYYQCYSGNDPFLPMSGPLPPHSPVGRIVLERDPLPSLCKSWPIIRSPGRNFHRCVFSHLVADAQIQLLLR